MRQRLRSLSGLAAWVEQTHPVDDGQRCLRVEGAAVTTNLMSLLGVAPLIGRGFTDRDAVIGNNTVVIISHGMWQRRFGGAQDVIGKRLSIEGAPYTIIGVMPRSFNYPNKDVEYWQPYAFELAMPESFGPSEAKSSLDDSLSARQSSRRGARSARSGRRLGGSIRCGIQATTTVAARP